MPYSYRKLTPEERQNVLQLRRLRGYPLHAPPHPINDEGRYLITAANFEHAHNISPSERRTAFEEMLLAALGRISAKVFGWVVLPNHYHVVLGATELRSLSATLKKLHGATSREWNLEDGAVGVRKVWYHFSDRKIRNEVHFYRALNYVHYNPVKHGYVGSPYDWPWSSVHNYLETRGREWLRERWKEYPPERMGRGWDE